MSSWKRTLGQWSICKSSFKMKGPNECRLVALFSLSKNCLCTLMPSITNSNRNVEANQSVVYCSSGSSMHQSGCLCLKYTESLSGCVGEGGGERTHSPSAHFQIYSRVHLWVWCALPTLGAWSLYLCSGNGDHAPSLCHLWS